MTEPRTLFDKIWQSHLVDVSDDGTCLIYIDRHLVHPMCKLSMTPVHKRPTSLIG